MQDPKEFYTGKDLAAEYYAARTKLPEQILTRILNFLSEKFDLRECVAVDVGCGSGQSTIPLAKHLTHVTGVDVSEAQINEGNRRNTELNISFKVGSAENLPVPDSSVHLVLASNSVHWFDTPAFFKEVDRVLAPNGVLAMSSGTNKWSCNNGREDRKMPQQIELADDVNDVYWSTVTKVTDMYDKLELPYSSSARKERLFIVEDMTMAAILNRVKSFAAVAQFIKDKPKEAQARLQDFQDRFMAYVDSKSSPEDTNVPLSWLYILCLTRKPN